MRKQKLVSDNIYHVYNRGVEKRQIFLEDRDYGRFLLDLMLFNNTKSVFNTGRKSKIPVIKEELKLSFPDNNRKPLVDILAFCLMANHFHLLLRQIEDNGITRFMRKIGAGYANYFNLKYQRVGSLFQGKFKSVLVNNEAQFIYIPHYIHLNPLDLVMPNWREKGVTNAKKALDFLDSYKWSSYGNYIKKANFRFLNRDIILEYFGGIEGYKKDLVDFISDVDISDISEIILE